MLLSNDEIVALAHQWEEVQTEAPRRRPGGNATVSSARLHLQGRLNMTRCQALLTPHSRSIDSDPLQIRIQERSAPGATLAIHDRYIAPGKVLDTFDAFRIASGCKDSLLPIRK